MKHIHFFQYNLPATNHRTGKTDHYINVIAEWNGGIYDNKMPIVYIKVLTENIDLIVVLDFKQAYHEIERLAEKQFESIAKQEKLNAARAELIAAGEIINNPVLDRYTEKETDLLTQETLS